MKSLEQAIAEKSFEPEDFDLEELKKQIYELEKEIKKSSSAEGSNHLGFSYLLFFISLIESAIEQLRKSLLLDSEFDAAQKALGLLESKKNEIISSVHTLIS
jgi:hypothetical protein